MIIHQRHFNPLYSFAILTILVSLSACGLLGGNRIDCSSDMLSMLKIQPPSGTKIVAESCSMDINPTYSATFTIAPSNLAAFQQATTITDWKPSADKAVSFKDKVTGLKSLLFGQFGNGVISEEVMIDTSNSQQFTIYFVRTFVD